MHCGRIYGIKKTSDADDPKSETVEKVFSPVSTDFVLSERKSKFLPEYTRKTTLTVFFHTIFPSVFFNTEGLSTN